MASAEAAPDPETLLRRRAIAVLEANRRDGYTVPAVGLYPFQWCWDSGPIALGWAASGQWDQAWRELRRLLSGQWESGLVPHIIFWAPSDDYFPGPDVWGTDRVPPTSGLTQPPLPASAAADLYRSDPDRVRADKAFRSLWPGLVRWLQWIDRTRRGPHGANVIVHPWESGMDNSPSWDSALERVPASSHEHIDRRDTRTVAADERPSQDEYRRYLGIVGALRNAGWDSETQAADSPFAVEDPGFTAITAHAAAELASVGAEAGLDGAAMADLSQRSLQGLESLWDEQLGWYRPFDVRAQTPTGPRTSCGAVAMWAGIDHSRAVRVAEQIVAWQRVMPRSVPTTDPADARFEPQRYWRGPVWVLINWLIATGMTSHGLADEADALRNATLQLVEAGFSEYYDPRTGTGIGGEGFSWSAALTLAWLTSDPPF